ncbi:hypothetical protein BD626DRAFT_471843 [Schizophyllum amplum]|uniref:Uncharacterized protein n=1 Tax=Schizophyllum amplum TaxID=97359 RepID=A0A550CVH9_9AGAR|nr:hypothetical protein BD626DRAFT_471843 [Auriculariopsis ampla]
MSARNFVPMAPASFPDDANLVDATNRQPLLSDPPQRRAPQQLGTEPATKLPVPSSPIAPVPHRRATSPVSPTSGTGLPLSSDARTLNAVISQLQAVWTDLPNEIAQNGTYRIDGWRDAAVDILESLIRVDAIMRSFMNVRLLERTDKGDRCAVRYRRHVGKLRGELKVLEKLPALQPASGILRLDLPILQRKARNIYNLERKITVRLVLSISPSTYC